MPTLPPNTTVMRTSTTPPFDFVLKTSGSNSDFLTFRARSLPSGIFYGGVYHNGHEPITAAFQHILRQALANSGPTCAVDAGMNTGFYALLFAAMGCHVTAFEVQTELVQLARLSAKLNGFGSRLDVRRVAVGAASGGVAYMADADGGGHSVQSGKTSGQSTEIRTYSLDDLLEERMGSTCANQPVAALKMDVEGFELLALAGLRRSLSNKRVRNLIFEFGPASRWAPHGQGKADGLSALETLFDSGYELRFIHQMNAPYGNRVRKVLSHPNASSWQRVAAAEFTYSKVPREHLRTLIGVSGDVNIWASLEPHVKRTSTEL